jgi:hypothetical protein
MDTDAVDNVAARHRELLMGSGIGQMNLACVRSS